MQKKFLMGNQAIALGALHAGVNLISGYPGTPSTEILETAAANKYEDTYVEWSVNEKAALEVAAGAAYCGARALVTMKQVGLNVACDPVMSLAYVGVKGGLVIVVCDDPGPISSQTEQDTRHFAQFAKLPVLDPSDPQQAYDMMGYAFELSEKYGIPVILRPTTRVCHACSDVDVADKRIEHPVEGFAKDPKWVIFPRLSYNNHLKLNRMHGEIAEEFSGCRFNTAEGSSQKKAIIASGVSCQYVREAISSIGVDVKLLCLATPNPFPEGLVLDFLDGAEEVLAVEELDPVIEDALTAMRGRYSLDIRICGKRTGHLPAAGENTYEIVRDAVCGFCGIMLKKAAPSELPPLPVRPPVLCAGCPHRASFYAVKRALKGKKAVFTGDIGCYTLGNAKPLDMVDTCLCMGADITMAQGMERVEGDVKHVAFIGDSTFFHTGIAGIVNGVYNQSGITVIILDNSTTAMTGHQPHPGTGVTMMGGLSRRISIEKVLEGCGVEHIYTADPFELDNAVETVKQAVQEKCLSCVVFRSPCIAVSKPRPPLHIGDGCIGCMRCVNEIGCPAISRESGRVRIDAAICFGCGLCAEICGFGAICSGGEGK